MSFHRSILLYGMQDLTNLISNNCSDCGLNIITPRRGHNNFTIGARNMDTIDTFLDS